MIIGIQDEILRLNHLGLLNSLLTDKSTKSNIIWATDAYKELGSSYRKDKEIQTYLITGENSGIIKNRSRKELEQQSNRTRQFAEVFTPLWICKKMNDYLDEDWNNLKNKTWKHYVDSRRLEITCGEAPYLVSRYDVSTGESISINNRIGILDRKLQAVNENTHDEEEWLKWTIRAFQSTYGYEFQGDSLLIARVNLLMTFEEYLDNRWQRKPTTKEYNTIINIIAWNLWQMDGLTYTVPYCLSKETEQMSIFNFLEEFNQEKEEEKESNCIIHDWRGNKSFKFIELNEGRSKMKFDYIIGNPPYQDETLGDNEGFAPPIYHKFLENAYYVGDRVEMIHPARFLFNAGSTPKAWNKKMLEDSHLKVLWYEDKASNVFLNTDIKGGVAITYHDKNKNFEPIGIFTPFSELNSILSKVKSSNNFVDISTIIYLQNKFNLESLYNDYPDYRRIIGSNGKDKRFRNNIFDKIPLFVKDKINIDDVAIIGVISNKRNWRYFPKKYIDCKHENLWKWKVLVVRVNGTGRFGEVLSSPIILSPNEGYTQTFIGIGAFNTKVEAENALKYIKTKFARAMLGVLKVTQDNNKDTWKYVPLQDFTSDSDIDWTKSISEIDQQLYAKYGLDEKEIEFIESHVKEMN